MMGVLRFAGIQAPLEPEWAIRGLGIVNGLATVSA